MLAQVEKWKREESDKATCRIDEQKARLAAVQSRLDRLLDVFLDGTITREDFTARKGTLLQEKATLQTGLDLLSRNAAGWLEPLEQFIKDAKQAESVAISEDLSVLRDFHRKIGSNLFVYSEINPQILSENPSVLSRRVSPSRVSVPPSRRAGRRLWFPLSRVRVEFPEPWRSLAARSSKSKWCRRRDLNPHTFRGYWILSPARLPFRHSGPGEGFLLADAAYVVNHGASHGASRGVAHHP